MSKLGRGAGWVFLAGLCILMAACGGSSGSTVQVLPPTTPTVTVTPSAANITTAQALTVTVAVNGGSGNPIPTGSVILSSGSYTSSATTLASGGASFSVPAGAIPVGSDTLSAKYTPDTAALATYNSASGTASVTVTAPVLITPAVTVTPTASGISTTQALIVNVTVSGGSGNPVATGSFILSSGSYASAATALSNGAASVTVPAGSLPTGTDTLTAKYTPDSAGAANYNSASGTGSVTVSAAPGTHMLTVDSAGPSSGVSITVSPVDTNGAGSGATSFTRIYNAGTAVTLSAPLSSGAYSFVSWSGCTSNPSASLCSVTMNADTTVTATFNQVSITSVAVTPNAATIGSQQQFVATVSGTGAFSKQVAWSLSCPSCGAASPGTLSTTGLYTTPYPAPPSVVITATSTQDQTKSGSATVTLAQPATATGPALAVDVNTPNTPSESPHAINPFVYGVNGYSLDSASAKIANPGLVRWGGDDVSRYNYKNHWTNTASDWYFENYEDAGSMFPNAGSGSDFNTFLSANIGIGTATLGTVPVLGWVANGANACSYNTSAFNGAQTSSSNYNGEQCGSGIWAEGSNGCSSSGGCNIQISGLAAQNTEAEVTSDSVPAPDITAASTPAPGSVTAAWANGTWPGGWVNSILTNPSYGNGASGKGVAMWDLDNEPTWWDAVHRDVHPVPFTYDEVTDNGIGTALAIKTADPTALVSGPVIDFWWAYFYSKKDIENGWSSGPCYEPFSNPTDRAAHNGVPLIEYYLQQFQSYSKKYGVRLLDYLDVHGYFAPSYNGNSVGFTTAGDTQEQQARMNGTRVFWDPTYTDPNLPQPNYTTDPNYTSSCTLPALPPQLVPMLQKWTANDYPGTKTGIDEYNFGGLESINGAVVQADILGIFGRQGLDMSALWPTNSFAQMGPATYAFAMYRNYDLANDGAVFGDAYLQATSTAAGADVENQLAVYAAQRTSDHAVTVMVINKIYGALTSTISLAHFTSSGSTAQVYQYSNANLTKIVAEPAVTITAPAGGSTTSTITATFPGQSITLLVVPD